MSGHRVVHAFAHRGGRAHGPDNTLETFRAALSLGAVGLETDAWLTRDGTVVLDHDGVHRAAKRRHEPMAEVRRDELPAHVPTLDELYVACGTDFELAIDVKLPEVGARVVEIAREFNATSRLWLVGGTPGLLSSWGRLDPDVHLAMTVRPAQGRAATALAARTAGADALNMRWMWWTARRVRQVQAMGVLAFAYDAQSTFALRRTARLGLDGVFSDHVDRMTSVLGIAR
ncbi:MAG: glycerophosphoryl diester phosphodiesterase [Frankiaceae bacterium]|nr:glycerophosphoryl diester phosphodiesterase [Frankiaceae bacterium]